MMGVRSPAKTDMRRWIPLTFLAAALAACVTTPTDRHAEETSQAALDHLETFARLYGYVRFFHPSDEATAADWDQIALQGVSQVLAAGNEATLKTTLVALFEPLAPSMQLYPASEPPPASITGDAAKWASSASWQYLGPGFGDIDRFYKRVRLGRPVPAGASDYGGIVQGNALEPSAGRSFRFSGEVRMSRGTGRLWIRFDDTEGKHLLLENMKNQPVRSRAWSSYDIQGVVPPTTSHYSMGVICNGDCSLAVRKLSLHFGNDAAASVEHVQNAGFEAAASGDVTGWRKLSEDYQHRVELSDSSPALVIERNQKLPEPLFAEYTEPGEVLDLALGSNLRLRLPLSVEVGPDGTLPKTDQRQQSADTAISWAASEFGKGITDHRQVQLLRDGSTRSVKVTLRPDFYPTVHRHAVVEVLSPGVNYVDLTRATAEDIENHVDQLAAAKALIVDLRGYPQSGGMQLLRHLLTQPEHDRWVFAPHVTHPDGRFTGVEPLGWDLQPAPPYVSAKVIVMTDASAISASESILGYFEGLHLGEIVGECSAGTNGNIQRVSVLGRYSVTFTGMKVRKHDGSRMFGQGFCPATPWTPTLAGLAAGKDELLEQQVERLSR